VSNGSCISPLMGILLGVVLGVCQTPGRPPCNRPIHQWRAEKTTEANKAIEPNKTVEPDKIAEPNTGLYLPEIWRLPPVGDPSPLRNRRRRSFLHHRCW